MAEDCSNSPKAPWLPGGQSCPRPAHSQARGRCCTALRPRAPQRRRQERSPSGFVPELVLYFTIQRGRGSKDPDAAAQYREVQTQRSPEKPTETQRTRKHGQRSPARSPLTTAAAAANAPVSLCLTSSHLKSQNPLKMFCN